QPGEMISPLSAGGAGTRTGIGTLVDMDSLEVEVDVNENFINRVQPGQPVVAKLNAYPEWEIPASVVAVIPTADRSKATVKVRVGFKVKDPRILPDMGVRVAFQEASKTGVAAEAPKGVAVPAEAIQVSGETGVVWVIQGEAVERRAVRVGGTLADGVRVIGGLSGGEQLAVGDFAKLQDGAKVAVQP
ncbi:MAG TPA: efflux RND transporter periplasmic adaptor subunit, partial [Solimonas sp.]|nr:efflux RND transporter periplasmic adaptor subunit [Solimonas sp.]